MRIGARSSAEHWGMLKEIGYDYAEGYFAGIALADRDEYRGLCEAQKRAGVPVEAVNGFFTGSFMLYEKSVAETEAYVREYADRGFYRVKELGAEIAVIGSGRSRSIPEGMARAEAEERFVSVLRLLGEMAQGYRMQLVIEPLRFAETNFIHTVDEALAISARTGCDNVSAMIDFFHSYSNGESLDCLKRAGKRLLHAHLARPNPDRCVPTEADREACRVWADALHAIGYDARISLEAAHPVDMGADIRSAYNIMKMFRYE
ncbi:MAG: sugar phosphate isomerase/epimerase [Clostridia bacterium]|nr:sugar phosphate isomerase/epimerase [Clostridia bacterium]